MKTDSMSPVERALQMVDNSQAMTRKYSRPLLLKLAENMGIPNPYGVPPVGHWKKYDIAHAIYFKLWQDEYDPRK
tara:strand:+ start:247 stop:471 length:225 start_codon:yes stop_codon:yes gene_type:complete